jgi:hypothetical protein
MIEDQSGKIEQRIDALLLVGGFAGSEYLFRKVEASSGDTRTSSNQLNCFMYSPSSLARSK